MMQELSQQLSLAMQEPAFWALIGVCISILTVAISVFNQVKKDSNAQA